MASIYVPVLAVLYNLYTSRYNDVVDFQVQSNSVIIHDVMA